LSINWLIESRKLLVDFLAGFDVSPLHVMSCTDSPTPLNIGNLAFVQNLKVALANLQKYLAINWAALNRKRHYVFYQLLSQHKDLLLKLSAKLRIRNITEAGWRLFDTHRPRKHHTLSPLEKVGKALLYLIYLHNLLGKAPSNLKSLFEVLIVCLHVVPGATYFSVHVANYP